MDVIAEQLSRTRAATVVLVTDLEDDLAAIAESTSMGPDDEHDPEGSTVGYERARVGSLLERTRRYLSDLDAALERVRLGTYGFCDHCGEAILPERLKVLPTATLCVDCAING
ncbi:MAG TPA: TraR/DksA C4-type zinc finger protein [Acidimicrobiales bacterium]|nr:TraR/DksA C4-type zinc finger protein [Acidimicrobiales bacterium]